MRHGILALALAACATRAPVRVGAHADAVTPAPTAPATAEPDAAPARRCIAFTERLPELAAQLRGTGQDRTFMLAPESTLHLDVRALGDAVASGDPHALEDAFARVMEPWVGSDPPRFETKLRRAPLADGGATVRVSFDAKGHADDYATCHGVHADFAWHGSFDVVGTTVTAFMLEGSGTTTEDMCSARNGGATRDTVGRYRAIYGASLSHDCEDR